MQKTLFILVLIISCLCRTEDSSSIRKSDIKYLFTSAVSNYNLDIERDNYNLDRANNDFFDDLLLSENSVSLLKTVQFYCFQSNQLSKKRCKLLLLPVSIDLPPPAII